MDKQQQIFSYQASDPQGHTITGHINASSEREAARLLNQQELTPLQISVVMETPRKASASILPKKAGIKEKIMMIRELATLLKAGISLAEAIKSMAEAHALTSNGQALNHISRILAGGGTLSTALQTAQLEFPEHLHQLVAAGELTGKLAQALGDAATQMEYEQRLAQEMRNALIYPAILVISGIIAILLVFIVVVPRFANMLKGNADIPALSVWIISIGLFVKAHLFWVGLIGTGLVMLAIVTLSNPLARSRLYEGLSHLPLVGSWLLETEIGRWANTLSTMLENRVPIIHAMELAQNGVRLSRLKAQFQQAVRDIRSGKKLADALASSRVIGAIGINLIRVGERSGQLGAMLRTLATLHENAGRDRMTRFLVLLEPAAILIIGAIIGTVMVAVMLAITSLSNIPL